jgi:hypothetical protein
MEFVVPPQELSSTRASELWRGLVDQPSMRHFHHLKNALKEKSQKDKGLFFNFLPSDDASGNE